jgi:hypothetical protein
LPVLRQTLLLLLDKLLLRGLRESCLSLILIRSLYALLPIRVPLPSIWFRLLSAWRLLPLLVPVLFRLPNTLLLLVSILILLLTLPLLPVLFLLLSAWLLLPLLVPVLFRLLSALLLLLPGPILLLMLLLLFLLLLIMGLLLLILVPPLMLLVSLCIDRQAYSQYQCHTRHN